MNEGLYYRKENTDPRYLFVTLCKSHLSYNVELCIVIHVVHLSMSAMNTIVHNYVLSCTCAVSITCHLQDVCLQQDLAILQHHLGWRKWRHYSTWMVCTQHTQCTHTMYMHMYMHVPVQYMHVYLLLIAEHIVSVHWHKLWTQLVSVNRWHTLPMDKQE